MENADPVTFSIQMLSSSVPVLLALFSLTLLNYKSKESLLNMCFTNMCLWRILVGFMAKDPWRRWRRKGRAGGSEWGAILIELEVCSLDAREDFRCKRKE